MRCAEIPRVRRYFVSKDWVTSFGVGGSVTVRALNILDILEGEGKAIYDHWKPSLSLEESMSIRRTQLTCDLFLTGTNALTLNGEIVNIDGAGNRVGATIFGPKKVVILAGVNKIVRDVHEAVKRISEVASPMNCKRRGGNTPLWRNRYLHRLQIPRSHLLSHGDLEPKTEANRHFGLPYRKGTGLLKLVDQLLTTAVG